MFGFKGALGVRNEAYKQLRLLADEYHAAYRDMKAAYYTEQKRRIAAENELEELRRVFKDIHPQSTGSDHRLN